MSSSENSTGGAAVEVDQAGSGPGSGRVAKSSLWLITTSNFELVAERVVRLGMASGAMFQSPAWRSLAIRSAPRGGRRALKSCDVADGQLVGGHLAAGGVVDDVLADA